MQKYEQLIYVGKETYWNLKEKNLILNNHIVHLPSSMSACLELLIRNMPQKVESTDLFNFIWDEFDKEFNPKSIRSLISGLRKKVPTLHITNHYGGAYSLEVLQNEAISYSQELLDNINELVCIFKNDKSLSMLNKQAAKKSSSCINCQCYDVLRNGDDSCILNEKVCPIEYVKSTKKAVDVIHENIDKDGNHYNVQLHVAPIFNGKEDVQEIMLSAHEPSKYIQTTKKLLQKIKELSYEALHDPLTRLPNRKLLLERADKTLKHKMRTNETFAIFFLDLNLFKNINDLYGHATGDELLVEIARRIKSHIRESDTLARLAGDEFVLIIENGHTYNHFENVAQKILKLFHEPFHLSNRIIQIGASIGVSLFPKDATTVEDLFHYADLAMYEAKDLGKNSLCFYDKKVLKQEVRW